MVSVLYSCKLTLAKGEFPTKKTSSLISPLPKSAEKFKLSPSDSEIVSEVKYFSDEVGSSLKIRLLGVVLLPFTT